MLEPESREEVMSEGKAAGFLAFPGVEPVPEGEEVE